MSDTAIILAAAAGALVAGFLFGYLLAPVFGAALRLLYPSA